MTGANRAVRTTEDAPEGVRKGLVIINTGDGKGKSTAAFGVMMRAWGHDMKVTAVQFIKQPKGQYGELMAAEKMGFEITPTGKGFTWESEDLSDDASAARAGWKMASERILSGDYDVVVLDEMTYPIKYGWIDVNDVLDVLKRRSEMLHVVITGRDAPDELVEYADLVTEMRPIKHPYEDQGIKAQKGVEF